MILLYELRNLTASEFACTSNRLQALVTAQMETLLPEPSLRLLTVWQSPNSVWHPHNLKSSHRAKQTDARGCWKIRQPDPMSDVKLWHICTASSSFLGFLVWVYLVHFPLPISSPSWRPPPIHYPSPPQLPGNRTGRISRLSTCQDTSNKNSNNFEGIFNFRSHKTTIVLHDVLGTTPTKHKAKNLVLDFIQFRWVVLYLLQMSYWQ